MKSNEELEQLKKEYEQLNEKLKQLSDDELEQVAGGEYKKDIGADKNAKVIFTIQNNKN